MSLEKLGVSSEPVVTVTQSEIGYKGLRYLETFQASPTERRHR